MDKLPKVRSNLQLVPAEMQGRQVFAVHDLLGLREDMCVLAPEVVSWLPFFDGEHSVLDLQENLIRSQGGRLVLQEEIEKIVHDLDELLLLETPYYLDCKQEVREAFAALTTRPAYHAGRAYPLEPDRIRSSLEDVIPEATVGRIPHKGGIHVLVSPHIELETGQMTYGLAYSMIRGLKPDRVIVLGTGHTLEDGLFSLTRKDYETPLGAFPTDREAVAALAAAGGDLVAPDDFAHRIEHSIEFQMLFLRLLLPGNTPLVPILFGSFDRYLHGAQRPSEIPGVSRFLQKLASLAREDTLLVAGVDFSHVGPKFGHEMPASHYEEEFHEHDERLLAALCGGSAKDFWAEGQRVGDRFHVCGFPVLASLLEMFPGMSGKVLDYQVWHEAATRSAVSFAAVALELGT